MPECVVVLAVPDEATLVERAVAARPPEESGPLPGVLFREPDLDNEATAYAVVCDGRSFSDLPLAGKARAMA